MSPVNHVVGVVADFNRDRENDYVSNKCCVFGMEEEEFQVRDPESTFFFHFECWSIR